jgi:iron complex outermembrane receptor protein
VRDALVQAREQDGRAFFENAARLRYHGIEAGFTADPAPWLSVQAAYTFTDGRFSNYRVPNGATVDTFDGKRPAGIPKHSLRGIVAVGSSRFRVEVEQQLTSDLYGDDRNTLPVAGWGAGVTAIRLTANAVVGGSAERQGVRLAPFVGINNLFDRRYISSVTVNGAAGRVYEPAPGRNLYLGMEVELGGRR